MKKDILEDTLFDTCYTTGGHFFLPIDYEGNKSGGLKAGRFMCAKCGLIKDIEYFEGLPNNMNNDRNRSKEN